MAYQSLETLPNDTSKHLSEDWLNAIVVKGPLSLEVSFDFIAAFNGEHG